MKIKLIFFSLLFSQAIFAQQTEDIIKCVHLMSQIKDLKPYYSYDEVDKNSKLIISSHEFLKCFDQLINADSFTNYWENSNNIVIIGKAEIWMKDVEKWIEFYGIEHNNYDKIFFRFSNSSSKNLSTTMNYFMFEIIFQKINNYWGVNKIKKQKVHWISPKYVY